MNTYSARLSAPVTPLAHSLRLHQEHWMYAISSVQVAHALHLNLAKEWACHGGRRTRFMPELTETLYHPTLMA